MPIWLLYSSMFMMVRCADLQSGYGILRYLWWYTVPIWLLYSSIFMVVRCADLVSGFWILDSGFFDVSLMFALMFASVLCSGFFPVGWKRQPEEGGIAPGCCGGGVITAWAAGDGVIAAGSAV